jgi:hypothetical protein
MEAVSVQNGGAPGASAAARNGKAENGTKFHIPVAGGAEARIAV